MILAVDIGGTHIKAGLVDNKGNISEYKESLSESSLGRDRLMSNVKKLIRNYKGYVCIGISTAGQVNSSEGYIVHADETIPGYTGTRIKDILESEFKVPVGVENDAYCAALGESHFGIKQQDFIMLTYGTGVGGAIVLGGKIYKGQTGVAAEFGSITTRKPTETDPGYYGRHGSTSALVRNAKSIDKSNINGRIIIEKINNGDKELKEVLHNWVDEVAIGLATLIHIFNPPMIILGGGIMEQDTVVELVTQRTNAIILESFKPVKIVKASLGNKAGILGAASLFSAV